MNGAFLPSDNIPWKAYKQCGIRSSVVTIDEPIFGRRKRDLYRAGDETILDENEIEISDDKIRADTRIANGRSLEIEGEWPWLAMLIAENEQKTYDPEVQCVGVLINCNTVMTTASCAKHSKVGNEIRVGTPTGPNSMVKRTIEKIIIHPAFTTTRKDKNIDIHHNNIAVVFVDSPVTEDILFEQGKVGPVCHTNDASHLNDNCWALGVTTGPEAAGKKPRVSSSVQLDVERQSLKYCNKYGYGEQLDDQQHICIKSKWESEKSGFCDLADNGAPVVCKRANSQNEFFLLGLYSSSESCSTFPKPAIFQETAGFDEWVQSTIQKERKCLCHRIIPGRQLIAPDMCCLNTPYNSGMKECCGGKLIDLESNHRCCFGVTYDQTTHRCSERDGLIIRL